LIAELEAHALSKSKPPVKPARLDILPVIILIAIVAIIGAGVWIFPHLQKIIQREDCFATGRADCG